jgi:alcohol dehydrogenase class IV
MKPGTYRYLAMDRVHFGRPAAQAVAEEMQLRGSRRALVVTSRTLHRTTDAIERATAGVSASSTNAKSIRPARACLHWLSACERPARI